MIIDLENKGDKQMFITEPYMEKTGHEKLVELLPHRWKLHQTQSMTNR